MVMKEIKTIFQFCDWIRNKFQIFLQVILIALINVLTATICVAFQLGLISEMEWLTTTELFLVKLICISYV